MAVLQQYYTSYVNTRTGSAGFQVKAMSPGISSELQVMISRLIAYRIPASMDERAISSHPIALRYYYLNAQESILLCSQSNGSDESGRPGNFFAHTLVLSPQLFSTTPPIFYWRSPFWVKKDEQERTHLSPLSEFSEEPSLDIHDVWTFLEQGENQSLFYRLMCAVIHGERSKRRIIIIDSNRHVALWIAAVSCMLPPAYRPLLSFSTYHHDPRQSPFLITGASGDTTFSLEEPSYFVLNAELHDTSDVEGSEYAKVVKRFGNRNRYEESLLLFFSRYVQRFPEPECIDEQLDTIALYARLREDKALIALDAEQLQLISRVVEVFEQRDSYNQDDLQDYKRLEDLLWNTYEATQSTTAQKLHSRIIQLRNKHQEPTDTSFMKEIIYYTRVLFRYASPLELNIILSSIQELHQCYKDSFFTECVNRLTYLKPLQKLTEQATIEQMTRFWRLIGPYLRPGAAIQPVLAHTLRIWGAARREEQAAAARKLFAELQQAIQGEEFTWLKYLVEADGKEGVRLDHLSLGLFYCELVSALGLELALRKPYRAIIETALPDIADTEFSYMLSAADLHEKVAVLGRWVRYTRTSDMKEASQLVHRGLRYLQKQCNEQEFQWLAAALLADRDISPLLAEWELPLLKQIVTGLSLHRHVREHVALYERYQNHPSLSESSSVLLTAIATMYNGLLENELVDPLYRYMHALEGPVYRQEARALLLPLCKLGLTSEVHARLVNALFTWKYAETFWELYWEQITTLVQSPGVDLEVGVRYIGYWFAYTPGSFTASYIVQYFFLDLRSRLLSMQKLPTFTQALKVLSNQRWYPGVQDVFQTQKGGWLLKQVQKTLSSQKVDEEKQDILAKIDMLFTKGTIRELHKEHLLELAASLLREQFWSAYRDKASQALVSDDVECLFELLSFWFDDAFPDMAQEPFYLAQDFFIGLPQVFDNARKQQEESFYAMSLRALPLENQQSPTGKPLYRWFPLVHNYFAQPRPEGRRSGFFHRSRNG